MLGRLNLVSRTFGVLAVLMAGLVVASVSYGPAMAQVADDSLKQRFEYLSVNGNSNCSRLFFESIARMPATALLQGSCCSPMNEHRYVEQVTGLQRFRDVAMIPTDPYDIPAGLAQKLIPFYELELDDEERDAYEFAMQHSNEKGPCCCQCWRWQVYGGLAKYLIREHDFTGEQVAEVWDLSDGCGGDDHVHS